MALAVDSEMPTNTGVASGLNPASPYTFAFNNVAGTLLLLVVGLAELGPDTATFGAVTYNGIAMTQVLEQYTGSGAGGKIAVYRLLNPATGSNTVSVAFTFNNPSISCHVQAGCLSFTGNNTSTPIAQNAGFSSAGTPSTTAAANLSGVAAGNLTVCGAGGGTHFTAETQTNSFRGPDDDTDSMGTVWASRSSSSGAVTHSFTLGGSDSWAAVMVEVAAAAAGGGSNAPEKLRIVQSSQRW